MSFDLAIKIFVDREQKDPTLAIGRKFARELGEVYVEAVKGIASRVKPPTVSVVVQSTDIQRRTLTITFNREVGSWAKADLTMEGGGKVFIEKEISLEEEDALKE